MHVQVHISTTCVPQHKREEEKFRILNGQYTSYFLWKLVSSAICAGWDGGKDSTHDLLSVIIAI